MTRAEVLALLDAERAGAVRVVYSLTERCDVPVTHPDRFRVVFFVQPIEEVVCP